MSSRPISEHPHPPIDGRRAVLPLLLLLLSASIPALGQPYAYVGSRLDLELAVIDTASNRAVDRIELVTTPSNVAISSDGTRVYLIQDDAERVAVVDAVAREVIDHYPVGPEARDVVVSNDRLYVSDSSEGSVRVLDASDGRLIANLASGADTQGLEIGPEGRRVYAVNRGDETVSVIDTLSLSVEQVPAGTQAPGELELSADGSILFVIGYRLTAIDTSTLSLIASTDLMGPLNSYGGALSPDGDRLYVVGGPSRTLSVLDVATFSEIDSTKVGARPIGIEVGADGDLLYVVDQKGGAVLVVDAVTLGVTESIPVAQAPSFIDDFLGPTVIGENCSPSPTTLCLRDRRFSVRLDWNPPGEPRRPALVSPVGTADSGLMYFGDPDNLELLIKVLRGCEINDHYWVFFAATTDVGFELSVTDELADQVSIYTNGEGQPADAITDTSAFTTCP